jgi:eukaryotic-like serine/threonine-protein kinase
MSTGSPTSTHAAVRQFGRFPLVRLLGKSERTMAWQVSDPQDGRDLVLLLPRVAPQGEDAMDRWLLRARKAARLSHPQLAVALEVDVHDHWPYVMYDLGANATLADRIGDTGMAPDDVARVASLTLQGLAFAHDAGVVHRDVQAFAVLVSDKGTPRLMGLEVSCIETEHGDGFDSRTLRATRAAAEADVLQFGVLMHPMLTGQAALDEPDPGKVTQLMPPYGRDIVRLPFSVPRPIPEGLRVIVNRATDRQERQRYHSARTLSRALDGWLLADSGDDGGPLALLLDRIRIAGVLPASPGGADRAARLALMERGRTDELAEVLLDDVALAFDLLRAVNTAQVHGTQVSGNGAVLTVRRSIAMIGLDGVRRVASALKRWPGPLSESAAADLAKAMDCARRAGRVAMSIRPAGYDGEVVYLITLLQNLGRLVVQYHYGEEAAQIRKLMQPAMSDQDGREEPGMSEQAASTAVLGVDIEAIGSAVARWWGLDDAVLHMTRRHSLTAPVRSGDNDDEILRLVGSCANEAVDAMSLPAHRQQAALLAVVQRYGRALGLSQRDLMAALQLAPPPEKRPPMPAATAGRSAAAPGQVS